MFPNFTVLKDSLALWFKALEVRSSQSPDPVRALRVPSGSGLRGRSGWPRREHYHRRPGP
ncbi:MULTISPECIES: hypothetical protein [unclassified Bradyrhizobium]|uniref:hypothetical protein n=1 Tax=unclassified Bradyrhizobium TaxID=2631580 RepID=UPI001FFF106E|nr:MULTISPECIES: hypothetical protein [unclassified Bradyrhizobium]